MKYQTASLAFLLTSLFFFTSCEKDETVAPTETFSFEITHFNPLTYGITVQIHDERMYLIERKDGNTEEFAGQIICQWGERIFLLNSPETTKAVEPEIIVYAAFDPQYDHDYGQDVGFARISFFDYDVSSGWPNGNWYIQRGEEIVPVTDGLCPGDKTTPPLRMIWIKSGDVLKKSGSDISIPIIRQNAKDLLILTEAQKY